MATIGHVVTAGAASRRESGSAHALFRVLVLAAVLGLGASPSHAQELTVTGLVLDAEGAPVAGARVTLHPLADPYRKGRLWLAGRPHPAPAAGVRSDRDGRFRLVAPDPGFWTVVVRARGHMAMEHPLHPLLGASDLEAVRLPVLSPITVRVLDAAGRPAAGVTVSAYGPAPPRERFERGSWSPLRRLGKTGEDGRARLSGFAGVPARIDAVAIESGWAVRQGVTGAGPVTLRLATTPAVYLRTVTARREPVPGAVVWSAGPIPVARTGPGGVALLPLAGHLAAGDELPPSVEIQVDAPADLVGAQALPTARPGAADEPIVVTLAPPPTETGRVVEHGSGRPVPGALVWREDDPEAAITTDAAGAFVARRLPGRDGALRAAAVGYVQDDSPAPAPGQESAAGTTLFLRRAATITGEVVDAADAPVAGAEIHFRLAPDGSRRFLGNVPRRGLARTDGAGRFRIDGVPTEAIYHLAVAAPGFPPQEVRVPPPPAESGEMVSHVRIVLRPGATLRGRIVDAGGSPIPGAEIALVEEEAGSVNIGSQAVESGAEGGFELASVAAGRVGVAVSAAGWADLERTGIEVREGETVDLGALELTPDSPVLGRVVDESGQPIAGARVEALPIGAEPHRWRRDRWVESAADGGFQVGGMAAGATVSLRAWKEGYAPAEGVVARTPTNELLTLVLRPVQEVTGQVVDERGRPVPQARVELSKSSPDGPSPWSSDAADEEGRFATSLSGPGVYTLEARGEGRRSAEPTIVEAPERGSVTGVEVVVVPAPGIAGQVVTARGQPIPGAKVWSRDGRNPFIHLGERETLTGSDGTFLLEGLRAGPVEVHARHPEFLDAVRELVLTVQGARVELVLERGVEVGGRLLEADGSPAPARRLLLIAEERSGRLDPMDFQRLQATTRAEGDFRFTGVGDGTYHLAVMREHSMGYAHPEPIIVAGASRRDIEVRLPREAILRGRVGGLDPERAQTVIVSAFCPDGASARGHAGSDGSYEIAGLFPCSWRVTGEVPGGGPRATAAVEIIPGETEVTADLRFEPGFTLTGSVRVSGAPLVGAPISLRGPAGGRRDATDHQGRFRFEALAAGSYHLGVAARSEPSAQRDVLLEGDLDLAIEIEPWTVRGVVVTGDGAPVALAAVRLQRQGPGGAHAMNPTIQEMTGTDGRFALTAEGEGGWRLTVEKEGFGVAARDFVANGLALELPEIVLQPTSGLEIVVTLTDGSRPVTVAVTLLDGAGTAIAQEMLMPSGPSGTVVLANVPPGHWRVILWAPGAANTPATIEVPPQGSSPETEEPRRIALLPSCELVLRVPELAGEPEPVRVVLTDSSGTPYARGGFQPDLYLQEGALAVDTMAPGAWTVSVTAADGRTWNGTVVTRPDQPAELVLE